MGPLRPLRRASPDRARRNPISRPHYAHNVRIWSDAEVTAIVDAVPVPARTDSPPQPVRERASRKFLLGLIVVVAINFGAMLGLLGWGILQATGWVAEPAVETAQREQGAAISQLEANFQGLSAAITGLSARADWVGNWEKINDRRMAEIAADVGGLRTSINELRTAQKAVPADAWREPVAELTAAATRSRSEILRLRASLDEVSRSSQPDTAGITARIDRIEHAMAKHDLFGPIRGSIRETGTGPRSVVLRDGPAAADGHIIDLSPVR